MNALPKVVFSRSLQCVDWHNSRLVGHHAVQEIQRLKKDGTGSMLIFGSADLPAALMRQGLIDEYRLVMVPIVLGRGTPLFKPAPDPLKLQLIEVRRLNSGGVILRYSPEPGAADIQAKAP